VGLVADTVFPGIVYSSGSVASAGRVSAQYATRGIQPNSPKTSTGGHQQQPSTNNNVHLSNNARRRARDLKVITLNEDESRQARKQATVEGEADLIQRTHTIMRYRRDASAVYTRELLSCRNINFYV
jgi:hypothetical protein